MDLRIKKVLKFIEENLDKKVNVKTITKYCCLGRSRFCELFKREIGIPFKAYLKRRRIEKAKELLKDYPLSIKQISYKVGYKSIPTFCDDFKRFTGLSPSEYRARCGIGKFTNKKFLTNKFYFYLK